MHDRKHRIIFSHFGRPMHRNSRLQLWFPVLSPTHHKRNNDTNVQVKVAYISFLEIILTKTFKQSSWWDLKLMTIAKNLNSALSNRVFVSYMLSTAHVWAIILSIPPRGRNIRARCSSRQDAEFDCYIFCSVHSAVISGKMHCFSVTVNWSHNTMEFIM